MNFEGSQYYHVEEIIRDGCYASDFKFSRADLHDLAKQVDALSFVDFVDVGPGTGFGTTTPKPEPSAKEHMEIVTDAVSNSGLTTLLLSGVASESDVSFVASHADSFDLVRIGADVDDIESTKPMLEAFADCDVTVGLNLLKTYLVSPAEAVDAAGFGVGHGADLIYVVDSAGGFVPGEVTEYVSAIGDRYDVEVGYHGHDNIGCGLENTLAAVRSGATYVDTSAQGVGRSAGNVQTELLCAHLTSAIPVADWKRLATLEETIARVYHGAAGTAVKDVLYGMAKFHSSFEGELRSFAKERDASFFDVLAFAARNELPTVEAVREEY